MEREVVFNILGCCICRDIFAIPESAFLGNQNTKYKVNKFYQFSSPISFTERISNFIFSIEMIKDVNMLGFNKKCLGGDLNKNNLEEVLHDSDYYIFDLTEFRFQVAKIILDNSSQLCTITKNFREIYDYLKEREWKGSRLEEIAFTQEQCILVLDDYLRKVLKTYPQEKCIMLENYLVNEYIDTVQGTFLCDRESFVDTVNEKLHDLYTYVKTNYPGINVIENPENNLGNIYHKWGKDNLHYIDEFYVYAIQAVNCIVEYTDVMMRRKKMEALQHHYSVMFKRIRNGAISATLARQNYKEENLLKDKHFNDLGVWILSKSRNGGYDSDKKKLYCNDAEKGWSILTQRLEKVILEKCIGNSICFSIEVQAEKKSKF